MHEQMISKDDAMYTLILIVTIKFYRLLTTIKNFIILIKNKN